MKEKLTALALILLLFSCDANRANAKEISSKGTYMKASDITTETKIHDIILNPVLGDWGRLLFPINKGYWSGETLGDLQLTWYSHINPQKTVEIVRYVAERAENGEQVFFDIYSEAEKRADPAKQNTGLFFFRGKPGAKTAICNAGGGFAYVGAMHDSLPHALELSKKGYNAFAPLGIDMTGFSLWGGSAGARMAAWLGSLGTEYFGEQSYPRPAAVIMQYTGLGEVYGNEPPTYNCVGTNDGIASFKTMERRINAIKANGTDAQIEVFRGLGHGFGLGQGTVAEGWIDNAVKFWEKQNE